MREQSEVSITVEFPMISDSAARAEFVDILKNIYVKRQEGYMADYLDAEGRDHE